MAEQGVSMVYDTVHMVLAQGDMVLGISEGTFGGAPTSYYDLWRVEGGKIAEHWDVMRERYVAIVGQTPDYRTCRLRGRVVRPADSVQRALVDRIFELNPSMNAIYPGEARYICDVFYVAEGQGEYFDLGQKPIFRKSFEIGDAGECTAGRFLITDGCIGCGTCAAACPEQCITPGTPYAIDQRHCLRCGICEEICPAQAIVRQRGA